MKVLWGEMAFQNQDCPVLLNYGRGWIGELPFEIIFAWILDSKQDFTDFQILQLQRIADSYIFWAGILDFACNKNKFVRILDQGRNFNCGYG